MRGYNENDYTVEKRFERIVHGLVQHVEIRKTSVTVELEAAYAALPSDKRKSPFLNLARRYLALTGAADKDGNWGVDFLLLYAHGDDLLVDADWARLTTDAEVQIDDLAWFEKIVGHAWGYTKAGGMTKYLPTWL